MDQIQRLIDKGFAYNAEGTVYFDTAAFEGYGKLSKKVLEELFENPKMPSKIIEEKGWVQISDEGAIKEVVLKVLENNAQSVADFKAGKDKA